MPGSAGPSSTNTLPTAHELLAAAYRREASKLHGELASEVAVAGGMVEEMPLYLPRLDSGHGGARPDLHRPPGRRRLEQGYPHRATDRGPRHGPGLRRRGGPSVRLGSETFQVGHGRAARQALDAVLAQWRFDPGERSALLLERDVPGHGGREVSYSVESATLSGSTATSTSRARTRPDSGERHQPGAGPAVRFGPLRPGGAGTMEIIQEVCERGVVERRVGLEVQGGEIVPGIVWLPEAATGPRPTVILGHGGVVHKRAPEVLGLARRLVRHRGYAAVALDAPSTANVSPTRRRPGSGSVPSRLASNWGPAPACPR